jgi:hypothetical protein
VILPGATKREIGLLSKPKLTMGSHRLNISYQPGNHNGMLRNDILTGYELVTVGLRATRSKNPPPAQEHNGDGSAHQPRGRGNESSGNETRHSTPQGGEPVECIERYGTYCNILYTSTVNLVYSNIPKRHQCHASTSVCLTTLPLKPKPSYSAQQDLCARRPPIARPAMYPKVSAPR